MRRTIFNLSSWAFGWASFLAFATLMGWAIREMLVLGGAR
jgi:hypothetical protein